MRQQLGTAECPTCNTAFHGLPLESDGDSTYAALEARPCADADCGALLCPACATFACDGCGDTFCVSHLVKVEDGTARPLQCCAACAAECEVQRCPLCDSANVYTDYIDLGIDSETGYHDEAAVFTCRACGVRGEAEELLERPAIAARPMRIEPARETRLAAAKQSA